MQDIQLVQMEERVFGMEIYHFTDQSEMENMQEEVVKPHRHDHYCCFFLESGFVNFNIDFQNLDIEGASLVISCPGQVHALGFAADITGWFLAFDARYADANARAVIEKSFSKVALIQLEEADRQWFSDILKLIYSARHEERETQFNHQLLQNLISAFFYKSVSLFQLQEDQRIQAYSSRRIEITKQFQTLVRAHFRALKKPAEYASQMNITVSYLNDTVKSVTGFSSTHLIRQEIFQEAQRQLFYTTKSVKEIAFQMGFEDEKYFIRLFGKTIGLSPARFRKASSAS